MAAERYIIDMKKVRLDQLVFERGLTPSRKVARTSVMAGLVFVNGERRTKPGQSVPEDCELELRGKTQPFVSRGGLKLEKALEVFGIDPTGWDCIDCGASTGGFTDCLLKAGAAHVYAVDVGYGQLAWSLRSDSRVTTMERTNARNLTPDMFPKPFDLAVMDLSFISLRLVIPAVKTLLKPTGEIACLIKPQFEAGKDKVGKKGVVRDEKTHLEVLVSFIEFTESIGFFVAGLDYSPVQGPEGNIEYLAHLKMNEQGESPRPENVVALAHKNYSDKETVS